MAVESLKAEESKIRSEPPDQGETIIPENSSGDKKLRSSRAAKSLLALGSASKYFWHACLGGVVAAEEKAVGFFNHMADKGEAFEAQARQRVTRSVNRVSGSTENIRHKAYNKITDLEHLIDDGINKSLHFMGVPSRNDMNKLTRMVNNMSESINLLAEQVSHQAAKEKRSKVSKKAG